MENFMDNNVNQPAVVEAQGYTPPVSQPVETKPMSDNANGFAIASLVVSIVNIACCSLSIPCAIVALVLGIMALSQKTTKRGMAIAGIIISGVALFLIIIFAIVWGAVISGILSEVVSKAPNYNFNW